MLKYAFALFAALSPCPPAAAFELPALRLPALPAADVPAPPPAAAAEKRAPAYYASYQVNGTEIAVPHIGGGYDLLAVLKPGETPESLSAKLRPAFGAPASAAAAPLQPRTKAELELAAGGARLVSLNPLLPPNAAALFNREPNFGGPNCFNAALTAAGLMEPRLLRHVGNGEVEQLLSMYFSPVPADRLKPGDVVVLNDGDHGVFYLGGGLVFHKKSYLKQHIYRIVPLERAYEPEPYEWKPGPFDSGSPFNSAAPIRKREAWRPNGASYDFGPATPAETARVNAVIFLGEHIEKQAPRWALSKELGYFTERLLENLVSDWSALAKSPNPVLRAYYYRLESFRDQANQSIEVELLSSPHAQANAYEILKGVWLPRNAYSRELAARLLAVYGKDPALADKALDAIAAKFEGSPLEQIKSVK